MSDLEQAAIERLRTASEISLRSYGTPLVITYSGGKDSDVLLHLGKDAHSWRSGVDVFHWWMEDGILPGQNVLEGFEVDKL